MADPTDDQEEIDSAAENNIYAGLSGENCKAIFLQFWKNFKFPE